MPCIQCCPTECKRQRCGEPTPSVRNPPSGISNKIPPKEEPEQQEDFSNIFEPIGLPEEEEILGMPTFEDILKPSLETIIEETSIEEDADQWFSRPGPETPQLVPGCMNPLATNYNPAATVDDGSCIIPTGPGDHQTPDFTRTSRPSASEMLTQLTERTTQSTSFTDHSPEGAAWNGPNTLGPAMDASMWDGIPYSTAGKSKEEICAWLRPASPWVVRGLRERYHEIKPFKDPTSPTLAEVNDWNLEVIRHIRNLLGDPTPINHDARLYLECRWADERMFTEEWDTQYPGLPMSVPGGSNAGPCHVNGNRLTSLAYEHCGASFFPSVTDRAPYLAAPPYVNDLTKYPELNGYNTRQSKAEGIRYLNGDMPWAIKLAQGIVNWICAERLGGHAGPYVGRADGAAGEPYSDPARTKFGCSFWLQPGQELSGGGSIHYRGKFSS